MDVQQDNMRPCQFMNGIGSGDIDGQYLAVLPLLEVDQRQAGKMCTDKPDNPAMMQVRIWRPCTEEHKLEQLQ